MGRPYKVRRICEMTRVHTGSCRTRFVRSAADGKKKKADAVPIDNRAGTTRVVGAFFFVPLPHAGGLQMGAIKRFLPFRVTQPSKRLSQGAFAASYSGNRDLEKKGSKPNTRTESRFREGHAR